jgi:hypothetical protein
MRVYYFVESKWAVENVSKRRLKTCRFLDLNDPFELLSGGLVDRALRKKVKGWAGKLNEQFGLICFSASWRNPLMWSHYCERHKGICLGFEAQGDLLRPIAYNRRRIQLAQWKDENSVNPPAKLKECLLYTKFIDWKYEDERRVVLPFKRLKKHGDLYFKPFDDTLKLVEVIAGHKCCVGWKPIIERAVIGLQSAPKPKLIKARLAFKKFEVVTQQRGFEDSNVWETCGNSCCKDHPLPNT